MKRNQTVSVVRAHRLANGIRFSDLAQRIDTTEANLSRIETGKQPVSADGKRALLPKLVAEGIPAELLRPDLAKLFAAARKPKRPAGRAG